MEECFSHYLSKYSNMSSNISRILCMRQLQFDVVSKRIELQSFSCAQMKEHKILFAKVTKKMNSVHGLGQTCWDKHAGTNIATIFPYNSNEKNGYFYLTVSFSKKKL